jgi:hypothetical protein
MATKAQLLNYAEAQGIPESMVHGILDYIFSGVIPGSFLQAVIANDLRRSVEQADIVNINLLPNYVRFFYNYVPASCWGSKEKMYNWHTLGGLDGMENEAS